MREVPSPFSSPSARPFGAVMPIEWLAAAPGGKEKGLADRQVTMSLQQREERRGGERGSLHDRDHPSEKGEPIMADGQGERLHGELQQLQSCEMLRWRMWQFLSGRSGGRQLQSAGWSFGAWC